MCKNKLFQSSETKNELHAKFKDENNSLALFFLLLHFQGEKSGQG